MNATILEKRIRPTITAKMEVNFAIQLLSPSVSAADPSITATYTRQGISPQLLRVSSGKRAFAIKRTTTIIRNPIRNNPRSARKIDELPLDIKLSIEYRILIPSGCLLFILYNLFMEYLQLGMLKKNRHKRGN